MYVNSPLGFIQYTSKIQTTAACFVKCLRLVANGLKHARSLVLSRTVNRYRWYHLSFFTDKYSISVYICICIPMLALCCSSIELYMLNVSLLLLLSQSYSASQGNCSDCKWMCFYILQFKGEMIESALLLAAAAANSLCVWMAAALWSLKDSHRSLLPTSSLGNPPEFWDKRQTASVCLTCPFSRPENHHWTQMLPTGSCTPDTHQSSAFTSGTLTGRGSANQRRPRNLVFSFFSSFFFLTQ